MSIKMVIAHLYRAERQQFLRQFKLPPGAQYDEDMLRKAHEAALEAVYNEGKSHRHLPTQY